METKHTQQVDFSNPNADKITSGTTIKPMESNQTAIEFLIKAFQDAYGEKVINVISVQVEQAKALEKEQIMDAFIGFDSDTDDNIEVAEQYYNETYNKWCTKD